MHISKLNLASDFRECRVTALGAGMHHSLSRYQEKTYKPPLPLYLHSAQTSSTFIHLITNQFWVIVNIVASFFALGMPEFASQPANTGNDTEDPVDASNLNDHQQLKETSDVGSEDAEKAEKPPPNAWMDPKSFPEGGAKAWLTVAGASSCLFVSFGWVNCVGIFQDYYQTHQLKEYSASNIAWIPALQSKFSSS